VLAACLLLSTKAGRVQASPDPAARKTCSDPAMLNAVFGADCKDVVAPGKCPGTCLEGYYAPAGVVQGIWAEPLARCFPNGT
jgi:hypothetical protein